MMNSRDKHAQLKKHQSDSSAGNNLALIEAKMAARKRWRAMQPGAEAASPVCYFEAEPLPDLETYMNLAAMQLVAGQSAEALARLRRDDPEEYARLYAKAASIPSSPNQ